MKFPLLLKYILLALSVLLNTPAIAQEDPPSNNYQERTALHALKVLFNNSFLNGKWDGPHCDQNRSLWYGIQCINGRVNGITLEAIGLTGNINSDALTSFTELSAISLKNNSVSGNVMDFSFNQHVKYIDLSNNKFHGLLSPSLLSLSLLETLYLQNNELTGSIPDFSQPSLKAVNFSDNKFEGPLPKFLLSLDQNSYAGNPGLCGSHFTTSCIDNLTVGHPKASHPSAILITINVVFLLAVVLLAVLYRKKSRELKEETAADDVRLVEDGEREGERMVEVRETSIIADQTGQLIFLEGEQRFEMSDLLQASAEVLGSGMFGKTYKVVLNEGPSIVVKLLRDLKPMTTKEFLRHLHQISHRKHQNLLPSLAYYINNNEKLLLYKYVPNGNLFFRIHGRMFAGTRIPFKWGSRLSVARCVGRALEYLHQNADSDEVVPHGNLKPSNVLLDENDTVFVTDYGLASIIAKPIASQRMVAYKSPEYQYARKITKQSDVWTYGCLLLELLTGRISACSAPPGVNSLDLCSWVQRAVREEWTSEIFDSELLDGRSPNPGMLRLLKIAVRCSDRSPDNRPEMAEVVREVEKIKVPEQSEEDADQEYHTMTI